MIFKLCRTEQKISQNRVESKPRDVCLPHSCSKLYCSEKLEHCSSIAWQMSKLCWPNWKNRHYLNEEKSVELRNFNNPIIVHTEDVRYRAAERNPRRVRKMKYKNPTLTLQDFVYPHRISSKDFNYAVETSSGLPCRYCSSSCSPPLCLLPTGCWTLWPVSRMANSPSNPPHWLDDFQID